MPSSPAFSEKQCVARLAATTLFKDWPSTALTRLVRASRVAHYRAGATVVAGRVVPSVVTLVLRGVVQSSVTTPEGRRVTFKLVEGGLYGMHPLLDGLEMLLDVIAIEPTSALLIPHAAMRAELANSTALWESVALEVNLRARQYAEQMMRFVFDAPRQRIAMVLLTLAQENPKTADGKATLPVRLPQQQLAEMIGVSRQSATALVRELTQAGLVKWRYGRVTVLDLPGLRTIANQSITSSKPDQIRWAWRRTSE